MNDICITLDDGCGNIKSKEVSFDDQHSIATKELKARGNPSYRPEAYIEINNNLF